MPGPDDVTAQVDAGLYNPDTPGLNAFTAAWGALTDFVGDWSTNTALDIQTFGDVVSGSNGGAGVSGPGGN